MKKLLGLFLALTMALSSFAQSGVTNTKAVRFLNAGDGSALNLLNGTIYYDEVAFKFKVYENGVLKDLFGSGSGWLLTGTSTLTGTTQIKTDNNPLNIISEGLGGTMRFGYFSPAGNNDDNYLQFSGGFGTVGEWFSGNNRVGGNAYSRFVISPSQTSIQSTSTAGNSVTIGTSNVANQGVIIQDQIGAVGAHYGGDYSAQGIAIWGNRWIPDKEYVDGVAGGGGWPLSGSGVFTSDVTIDADGNSLFWENFDAIDIVSTGEVNIEADIFGILTQGSNGTSGQILTAIGDGTCEWDDPASGGWPLTGSASLTGDVEIDGTFAVGIGLNTPVTDFGILAESGVEITFDDGAVSSGLFLGESGGDGLAQIFSTEQIEIEAQGNSGNLRLQVGNIATPIFGLTSLTLDTDGTGIKYDEDLSATFVNRSLVDKEYVDNAVGGGGGWPLTGTAVLTGDVEIGGATGTYSTSIGTIADNMLNFSSYGSGAYTVDYGGNTQLYGDSGNKQLQLNTTGIILDADNSDLEMRTGGDLYLEASGSVGASGEVLTSNGTTASWQPAGGGWQLTGISTLTGATQIKTDNNPLNIISEGLGGTMRLGYFSPAGNNDDNYLQFSGGFGTVGEWFSGNNRVGGNAYSRFVISPSQTSIQSTSTAGNSVTIGTSNVANQGVIIQDQIGAVGMHYGSDYSVQGIATWGNRWIPDKEYVDVAVSDVRFKTDINALDRSLMLSKLMDIEPIQFHWDKTKRPNASDDVNYGVSAQQTREVFPELVAEHEDGTLGIKRDQLVGVLLASVQGLMQRIEALEEKVAYLEAKSLGKSKKSRR